MKIERLLKSTSQLLVVAVIVAGTVFASAHERVAAFLTKVSPPVQGELVPRQLLYRGFLERDGRPVTSPSQEFSFALLRADGGVVWTEPSILAPTLNGHFEISLGDNPSNRIPDSAFSEPFVALTASVSGIRLDGTQRVLGAPFAARALDSWRAADATRAIDAINATTAAVSNFAADAGTAQVAHRLVVNTPRSFSFPGRVCGATAPMNGDFTYAATSGNVRGYAAAKMLCEDACSSPSSHICTSFEFIYSQSIGDSPSVGWIATGVPSTVGGVPTRDCIGFSSSLASEGGTIWNFGGGSPGVAGMVTCNTAFPIMCCD
jgi:hypothetical protein